MTIAAEEQGAVMGIVGMFYTLGQRCPRHTYKTHTYNAVTYTDTCSAYTY